MGVAGTVGEIKAERRLERDKNKRVTCRPLRTTCWSLRLRIRKCYSTRVHNVHSAVAPQTADIFAARLPCRIYTRIIGHPNKTSQASPCNSPTLFTRVYSYHVGLPAKFGIRSCYESDSLSTFLASFLACNVLLPFITLAAVLSPFALSRAHPAGFTVSKMARMFQFLVYAGLALRSSALTYGPSSYAPPGAFPTSLYNSYYNNPTATSAQPQPVVSDPVLVRICARFCEGVSVLMHIYSTRYILPGSPTRTTYPRCVHVLFGIS